MASAQAPVRLNTGEAVGPDFGFGLYVHWPYCSKICPYCDFNVYAAKDRDTAPLVEAIRRDIESHKALLPDHPALDSLFFGGGTPSLLSAAELEDIVETAHVNFGFIPGAEITVEANPNDVLRSDLKGWQAAGINRVSMGVQSLDDRALEFLGRDHDSSAALQAISAMQTAFENHSIDLIYALPGQTLDDWTAQLLAVLALGAPHLSLYELTIEERTAFGKRAARGELIALNDDAQADLYETTQALCTAAGLPAYEVSNHARAPRYEARHNHIYWNSGDWIGVGPGAHGRLTVAGDRLACEAARRPADYLMSGAPKSQRLSREETAFEFLAMGLRPATGLDLLRFETLFGRPASEPVMSDLVASGFAKRDGTRLRLTVAGRLICDHIAGQVAHA